MGKAKEIFQKLLRTEEGTANRPQESSRLNAEWKQDYSMAQERKETGKEPANRPLEIESPKTTEPSLTPQYDQIGTPHKSLVQQLSDSGWKLSSSDERAVSGYEQYCIEHSIVPHPNDAADYVLTSRDLTEQDRKDQAAVQRLWDRETGIDR